MEEIPQFDRINTGITNEKRLREMVKIWGEKNSTSKTYVLYKGKKQGNDEKEEI